MKVNIKGKEYEFSFSSVWGVLYNFESLTKGKVEYNGRLMLHNHIAMYGILLYCNDDFVMDFDEFVEALNDMELSKQLLDYYTKRMDALSNFGSEEDEEPKKKRKD